MSYDFAKNEDWPYGLVLDGEIRMTERNKLDYLILISCLASVIGVISVPFGNKFGMYTFWFFGALFMILRGYEVFFKWTKDLLILNHE